MVDVHDPAQPTVLGRLLTAGRINDVEVIDNRAYVTAMPDYLLIIDITIPALPTQLGSYRMGTSAAYDVQVVNNLAYVATLSGLLIIDITIPANPVQLGRYQVGAYDLHVVGTKAYVATGYGPLHIIDVSEPTNPRKLGDSSNVYAASRTTAGVQVIGNYAYVTAADEGLLILSIVNPTSIRLIGSYNPTHRLKDVFVDNERAYVTSWSGVLDTVNVSVPQQPTLISSYDTPGASWDVRVANQRAYLADGGNGLAILDLAPSTPALLGRHMASAAEQVTVQDGYAFVAAGLSGLVISDVRVPASPTRVGQIALPGFVKDVEVVGDYAFVVAFGNAYAQGSTVGLGLHVIDLQDLSQPVVVGNYDIEEAQAVQIVGERAYVAAWDGLYILDVSSPELPTLVSKFSGLYSVEDVQVIGMIAYIVTNSGCSSSANYIASIDVTVPTSPILLSKQPTNGSTGLWVDGAVAYVTNYCRYGGPLLLFEVTDPRDLRRLGSYESSTGSTPFGVFAAHGLAYVAKFYGAGDGEIEILDVRSPANPISLAVASLATGAQSVLVVGEQVYVAAGEGGLVLLRSTIPAPPPVTWTPTQTPTSTPMYHVSNPAYLVQETAPGSESWYPNQLTTTNDGAFFVTSHSNHYGLWYSDGTANGTVMLEPEYVRPLITVEQNLFYLKTNDGLWKTDGTVAGTQRLAPMGDVYYVANVDGTLFLSAGTSLWKSDGTPEGTVYVTSISGAQYSILSELTNVNGTLFFVANQSSVGSELWKSDGTAAGTVLVKDILPGEASSYPQALTNVNGSLFFFAKGSSDGHDLWMSDGTAEGTTLIKHFVGDHPYHYPASTAQHGNLLFFNANDGVGGLELWRSDGTIAGTFQVKDINPGAVGSRPYQMMSVGSKLFFVADDGAHGYELWTSDGTTQGTALFRDINPGTKGAFQEIGDPMFSIRPATFKVINGVLLFTADDGSHGYEPWISYGTTQETFMVQDIEPGFYGSGGGGFVGSDRLVFFNAQQGSTGSEVWAMPAPMNPLAPTTPTTTRTQGPTPINTMTPTPTVSNTPTVAGLGTAFPSATIEPTPSPTTMSTALPIATTEPTAIIVPSATPMLATTTRSLYLPIISR